MGKVPNIHSLRSVPELKYINADNVTRYRAIMRFLYGEYLRLNYWLKSEDVYEGIMSWNLNLNYTLEQCQIDLDQLVEWGNLSSRHDGGKAVTVDEYLRKKYQYLLTPYSIEIERLLESLENVRGYGGSLEPTLFDTIADCLIRVRKNAGEYEADEARDIWNTLYGSFQTLHEASVDYIASLQTNMAEDLMVTDAFLLYKDSITRYLQDFIQALQRRSYRIEGNFEQITPGVKELFIQAVLKDEWRIPKMEVTITQEQYYEQLLEKWEGIYRWFVGGDDYLSEMSLLERATKEAIVKIVRCAVRIQERKSSGISRKKELDYLGQWFYRLEDVELAHTLAAYVFGMFPTRHLLGVDRRESDSQEESMWEQPPIEKTLRSRSRKKQDRQDGQNPIMDKTMRKNNLRKIYIEQHKQEYKFLKSMVGLKNVEISNLERITTSTRIQILQWISRCLNSPKWSLETPEGVRIQMEQPESKERTTMQCEDGDLELLNYSFTFSVINQSAWEQMLHWVEE
ncbi:TIGR02677 family protein [Paenibacillus uliginis N3/975]|uniref:TIGR02677 family protein n=1 Tax=Paenibacillus uliginis N3/975 TaxID=1313296 RepID=A0A1X7HNY1_9BACL|nr:TIGR02677 family protein [Paenibacillus uliginis N3/975]